MKFVYPPGATPLSAEDMEGLIPEHISVLQALRTADAGDYGPLFDFVRS